MKRARWLCCAAALMLSAQARSEDAPPPKAPAMETVIVADRDAAVGLYLLPWKEEAASDIDLPPRLHDVPAQALDPIRFARRTADDEADAAYRRVRVEPRP